MITSVSNAQVKYCMQLAKKSRLRREKKEFIIEGIRMFEETPKNRIKKVYITEKIENTYRDVISDYNYEVVSEAVFSQMADTKTPQGILAIVGMVDTPVKDIIKRGGDKAFLLAVEDLQDPGNLGTIIRTAEGAGVTGIIMSGNTVDIYNPKTIRSTMGAIYRMPFAYVEDFVGTIENMKQAGIEVYAAHLDGEKYYDGENYCKKTAFLIGNEGNGLSCEAAQAATKRIKIPMEGQLESLNAAVASAILMYEVNRQRRN